MDVRAAFYWDVKSNSISYLITTNSLQDGLDIYSSPEQFKINSKESPKFHSEVLEIIKNYFNKMENMSPISEIVIEFKILNHGGPAHLFNKHMAASDRSSIVLKLFNEHAIKLNEKYRLKLGPQMKSLLKGDALNKFKLKLKGLGLINNLKDDAYKWHLWSIFLHASSKNYDEKIRKQLWRPIIDAANSLRDNGKRYKEWLRKVI